MWYQDHDSLTQLNPSKDPSRDRECAVIPIIRVTVIIVTFRPNDTLLARGPCRPGSPYVRAFNPARPTSLTPFQSGPKPTAVGPRGTRASDASQQVVRSSGM